MEVTGVSYTQLLNPLKFLGIRNGFCSNEATLGGFLGNFRMGTAHQKDQVMIRSQELLAPLPHPPGRGERLEIEFVIEHAYVLKPPLKTSKLQGLEGFPVGLRIYELGVGATQLHRDRSAYAQDPSRSQPMYLIVCTFITFFIIKQ